MPLAIEVSGHYENELDLFFYRLLMNCSFSISVNCTIWDGRDVKKVEMSVLDISSAIIKRVEAIPDTCDYVYIGLVFSLVLSLVPAFCRLCEVSFKSHWGKNPMPIKLLLEFFA